MYWNFLPENVRSRPKQWEINTRNSTTDCFLSVLFIDVVICWVYMASVIDDKTSMDRWWNDSDGEKPKCWLTWDWNEPPGMSCGRLTAWPIARLCWLYDWMYSRSIPREKEKKEDCLKVHIIRVSQQYWVDIIVKTDMSGECSMHGLRERCLKILIGKLEGKRPLGRSSSRLRKVVRKLIFKNIMVVCGL